MNMKLCCLQPKYLRNPEEYDEYFSWIVEQLRNCEPDLDLMLLPEACNAPSSYLSLNEFQITVKNNTQRLLDVVQETAVRCEAYVAVNLMTEYPKGLRNTTFLYDRHGKVAATYFKQHMPVVEKEFYKLDDCYSYEYNPPVVVELESVRIGFLTCYDMYFSEYFANLATKNPDLILVSSHQRGERQDIIEMQAKNCAFTCNAYLLRSSVSMGPRSNEGGNSMLVAPDGNVIKNIGQKIGTFCVDVDIKKKHIRSNGYGQPDILNNKFIENGRTPWCYRAGGSMVRPSDSETPYPRVCSHRGFNTIAPENSLPAFAAAIALGAEEIELDVWPSADQEIIVCHDQTVDRMSNGKGLVSDLTYEQIRGLDIGGKFSEPYRGLRFPRFEDVLKAFSRQVIINLHIKSRDRAEEYDHRLFRKIVDLIYKYDCSEHVYIAGEVDVLKTALELAPELRRCCLDGTLDYTVVETAVLYKCHKVQLVRDHYNQEMIDKAHENGIRCNLFWSDDPDEAVELVKRGIDTILTNDYLRVARALDSSRNTDQEIHMLKEHSFRERSNCSE